MNLATLGCLILGCGNSVDFLRSWVFLTVVALDVTWTGSGLIYLLISIV